jgi:hypothetical protein
MFGCGLIGHELDGDQAPSGGWITCTRDDLIAERSQCWCDTADFPTQAPRRFRPPFSPIGVLPDPLIQPFEQRSVRP